MNNHLNKIFRTQRYSGIKIKFDSVDLQEKILLNLYVRFQLRSFEPPG